MKCPVCANTWVGVFPHELKDGEMQCPFCDRVCAERDY